MYLSLNSYRWILVAVVFAVGACSSPQSVKPLTPMEQISVDTQRAASLAEDFRKKVRFVQAPRLERFLGRMGTRIARASKDFPLERVEVRIHHDADPDQKRAFSFPGTLISLPLSELRGIDYENELAAWIAFELSNVINRHLARRVESEDGLNPVKVSIFGSGSVFDLDREERAKSIRVGTELLYFSGYDVRGMASMFQRAGESGGKPVSESLQKEVDFNVRESQRARSGLIPPVKPLVRSSEFIQFKRELGRIR